jgi:hypothetical protein
MLGDVPELIFKFTIHTTDGKIIKHHITTSRMSRAHALLDQYVAKGVTVYNKESEVWIRVSPRYINRIELLEVK